MTWTDVELMLLFGLSLNLMFAIMITDYKQKIEMEKTLLNYKLGDLIRWWDYARKNNRIY